MSPVFDPAQLKLISPEIVLTVSAFLILGLAVLNEVRPRLWAPALALLACAMTLAAVVAFPVGLGLEAMRAPATTIGFNGMFILDAFSIFFKVAFLLGAILTILTVRTVSTMPPPPPVPEPILAAFTLVVAVRAGILLLLTAARDERRKTAAILSAFMTATCAA